MDIDTAPDSRSLRWKRTTHNGRDAEISECGNYLITNFGKRRGNQYCRWKRVTIDVNVPTGKKRKPFERVKFDCFCRLVKMGTFKEVH